MPTSREELERLKALVAARDPLRVAAVDEVDRSLLEWFATRSPLERLAAGSNAAWALHRFHRVRAPKAGQPAGARQSE